MSPVRYHVLEVENGEFAVVDQFNRTEKIFKTLYEAEKYAEVLNSEAA